MALSKFASRTLREDFVVDSSTAAPQGRRFVSDRVEARRLIKVNQLSALEG